MPDLKPYPSNTGGSQALDLTLTLTLTPTLTLTLTLNPPNFIHRPPGSATFCNSGKRTGMLLVFLWGGLYHICQDICWDALS